MENAGSERMDFVTSDMSRRIAAWCAIVGGGLGLIATLFHPRDFVAYDSAAHLKTIAENATWTVDHFAFVVATFLILWGLIATVDVLAKTPGALLAKLAADATMIGSTIAAIFFAIDGFGMKAAAGLWLQASPGDAGAALNTALLMAKLGVASVSIHCLWYLGVAPLLFGAAILRGAKIPRLLGLTAILGGILGLAAGIGFYLYGDSVASTVGFVLAQTLFLVWTLGAGIVLLRFDKKHSAQVV